MEDMHCRFREVFDLKRGFKHIGVIGRENTTSAVWELPLYMKVVEVLE
jgi:hypothetical protein